MSDRALILRRIKAEIQAILLDANLPASIWHPLTEALLSIDKALDWEEFQASQKAERSKRENAQ